MMAHLIKVLGRVSPRLVVGGMLLVLSLMVFESWMLALRRPVADYRQARATRLLLAASLQQSPQQVDELSRVAGELKLLTEKLRGQLRIPASDDEMAALLMSALDQSATRFGIALSSMKPGARKQVSVFEEVTFEVGGTGNYLQLCQWMLELEQSLGSSASITEFDMKSAGEAGLVQLSFNIAVYRPLKLTEGVV